MPLPVRVYCSAKEAAVYPRSQEWWHSTSGPSGCELAPPRQSGVPAGLWLRAHHPVTSWATAPPTIISCTTRVPPTRTLGTQRGACSRESRVEGETAVGKLAPSLGAMWSEGPEAPPSCCCRAAVLTREPGEGAGGSEQLSLLPGAQGAV